MVADFGGMVRRHLSSMTISRSHVNGARDFLERPTMKTGYHFDFAAFEFSRDQTTTRYPPLLLRSMITIVSTLMGWEQMETEATVEIDSVYQKTSGLHLPETALLCVQSLFHFETGFEHAGPSCASSWWRGLCVLIPRGESSDLTLLTAGDGERERERGGSRSHGILMLC